MTSTFPTTFAAPVSAVESPPAIVTSTSPSRHSSRSTSARSKRTATRNTTAARAPPLPVPARSSSIVKQAETLAPSIDPLRQLPFGASLPNMYESSASLSPSDDDAASDSDAGIGRRARRHRINTQASTSPTTASSSASSVHKSFKSIKSRQRAAVEGKGKLVSPTSPKRSSPSKRAALPSAAARQGLGFEVEGLGWGQQRGGMDVNGLDGSTPGRAPMNAATYTSDLGSGISTQESSPEVPQMAHADSRRPPPPTSAFHSPPTVPMPPSPSHSRPPRSRRESLHSNAASEASRGAKAGAPRFLAQQVESHEHQERAPTQPSVELHPQHIVFPSASTSTAKSASRRSSTASNIRTPSLIHSPASTAHGGYPDTPALPSPSTYAHRDQQPQPKRNMSVSSLGSVRSQSSSQAYTYTATGGLPTPQATRFTTSNAYFPPPPPPKSPRRYASPSLEQGEDGSAIIPQVFPSTRPRQSLSAPSRAASAPFPGPPASLARSQRSQHSAASPPLPAPTQSQVFPSAPRRPSGSGATSTSPARSRKSEIFPSARSPAPNSSTLRAREVSGGSPAPWERSDEDELDWMISAQRKVDPARVQRSPQAVKQVFATSPAARRAEQPRGWEEQKQYEREEGGLGEGGLWESVADIDALMLESQGELEGVGEGEEALREQERTPRKPSGLVSAAHHSPVDLYDGGAVHAEPPSRIDSLYEQSKRQSTSSAASGASEYASAAEHDDFSDSEDSRLPHVDVLAAPALSDVKVDESTLAPGGLAAERRMSAIGEVSENEASGGVEEQSVAGRLNMRRLSLASPSPPLDEDSTPLAGTPVFAQQQQRSSTPPMHPQVSSYPSAFSPSSLRSPKRPSIRHSTSFTSYRAGSLYNHSNASSLSAQTHLSDARSTPASQKSKGRKGLGKKIGALFGAGGGGKGDEQSMPQGISSEQVKMWHAAASPEAGIVGQAAGRGSSSAGGSVEGAAPVNGVEEGGKKDEVVHFESLLEKFAREERGRLVELKASKWAAAQAASAEPGTGLQERFERSAVEV